MPSTTETPTAVLDARRASLKKFIDENPNAGNEVLRLYQSICAELQRRKERQE